MSPYSPYFWEYYYIQFTYLVTEALTYVLSYKFNKIKRYNLIENVISKRGYITFGIKNYIVTYVH